MIVKCAWCGAVLGRKPGRGVSHDICDACMRKYFPEFVEDNNSHGMGQPGGNGLGNQEPKKRCG